MNMISSTYKQKRCLLSQKCSRKWHRLVQFAPALRMHSPLCQPLPWVPDRHPPQWNNAAATCTLLSSTTHQARGVPPVLLKIIGFARLTRPSSPTRSNNEAWIQRSKAISFTSTRSLLLITGWKLHCARYPHKTYLLTWLMSALLLHRSAPPTTFPSRRRFFRTILSSTGGESLGEGRGPPLSLIWHFYGHLSPIIFVTIQAWNACVEPAPPSSANAFFSNRNAPLAVTSFKPRLIPLAYNVSSKVGDWDESLQWRFHNADNDLPLAGRTSHAFVRPQVHMDKTISGSLELKRHTTPTGRHFVRTRSGGRVGRGEGKQKAWMVFVV